MEFGSKADVNLLGSGYMCMFIVCAFSVNVLLVFAIVSDQKLRQSIFHLNILHICLILLLDVTVAQVFGLYTATTNAVWIDRITVLVTERAVALVDPTVYSRRVTRARFFTILTLCCVMSAGFSLASLWNPSSSLILPFGSLIVICYCLPLVTIFLSLAVILYRAHQYRVRNRWSALFTTTDPLKQDLQLALYAFHVFLLYLFVQGPSALLDIVLYLFNYGQSKNELSDLTILLNDYRIVLFSIRSQFALFFPIITFSSCAAIRHRLASMALCRTLCLTSSRT
ncbi:Location of vulva defective [Trichinella spiralis]|uniref:Location of vulva defective n=1 Tax=Trichinella spiralis TaxID=6334 RepID=A0ABR3KKA5_TRISP